MPEQETRGSRPRQRLLFCAGFAAAVLGLLALLSWPAGMASRELVREDLRQLHNTEWSMARGEPGRVQSLSALARIADDLLAYVDSSSVADPAGLRADLTNYVNAVEAINGSARIRDDQLLDLRDRGTRISRSFEEGMTSSVTTASRWRIALFAWCALLMALLLVGARRLARAESALAHGPEKPANEALEQIARLEAALAEAQAARIAAE